MRWEIDIGLTAGWPTSGLRNALRVDDQAGTPNGAAQDANEETDALLEHLQCLGPLDEVIPRIGRPTNKSPAGQYREEMHHAFPSDVYGDDHAVYCFDLPSLSEDRETRCAHVRTMQADVPSHSKQSRTIA